MMYPRVLRSRQPRRAGWQAGLFVALLVSCSGTEPGGSRSIPSVVDGRTILSEPNQGGSASELILTQVHWGRLVDVYSQTEGGERILVFPDFVIGPDVVTDGGDYLLERSPVTSRESLVVQRDFTVETDVQGRSPRQEFLDLVQAAEANLTPVFQQGSIISMVPRNATLVLRFQDLLDPETIHGTSVRVLTGLPAVVPYEARILADPNHGGVVGGAFYPTRVLVDMTISALEVAQSETILTINGVGLPASTGLDQANVELRVGTQLGSFGSESTILRNLSGAPLSNQDGTIDFNSERQDWVRPMRSGGRTAVTGDADNGFLPDPIQPRILGRQAIDIVLAPFAVPHSADSRRFILPEVRFAEGPCVQAPRVGDAVVQAGVFAEVVADGEASDAGVVQDVHVRLLSYPPEWDELEGLDAQGRPGGYQRWLDSGLGPAQYVHPYDAEEDAERPECFVQVLPTPAGAPTQPLAGCSPSSTFSVEFNEPMDPASLTAFDSLTLTRQEEPEDGADFVVGTVRQSLDLGGFTFLPDLPLAHEIGSAETYYLKLSDGDQGPVDLAGNPLEEPLPLVRPTVAADAPTRRNGGRVSRFESADGTWGGQLLYDLDQELVRPRPVVRFDAVIDSEALLPGAMAIPQNGVQTPLSNLGSKMQTVWRHADMGFSVQDENQFNLDVEGLSWAPLGGQVNSDVYSEFEIRLAHSRRLPDEYREPGSQFPLHFKSGLLGVFANNVLQGTEQAVVHPRQRGYVVAPSDRYVSSTSTVLMPYPLNRGVAVEDFQYYTWRDTSLLQRAGPNNRGAEVDSFFFALGFGATLIDNLVKTYSTDEVRSVALPLLMEFRTYPDESAFGQNTFDIRIATNSSAQPYFRAFSTGGSGNGPVDPDTETSANGGWNPTSDTATFGRDPVVYFGSVDFVVRVSRAHSVWFPVTSNASPGSLHFSAPVLEPTADQQPLGTSIDLDFRGALSIEPQIVLESAQALDGYGDYYADPLGLPQDSDLENPGIVFLNGDSTWRDEVAEIDGANYFQVRATFTSNAASGQSPELSAIALAWGE